MEKSNAALIVVCKNSYVIIEFDQDLKKHLRVFKCVTLHSFAVCFCGPLC